MTRSTYDLSVRTEVGHKSTTLCTCDSALIKSKNVRNVKTGA